MALSIDILENKIEAVINGQIILDLVTPSINDQVSIGYSRIVVASDEMIMRPDLGAQMYCGSQNNVGVLLKMNSISNPFSLNSGEILLIPDSQTVSNIIKEPAAIQGKNDARTSFRKQLQDRISKISETRKEYLNSVSISQTATQTPLPPNVAQQGTEQFKVTEGKLIFGSDVGVCRTKIQQNKSVATIKSRFAQRQIFES